MSEPVKADDSDFEEKVLKSDVPVLVDFFGEWCAPCQKMKPVLAEIARETAGRAKVVEVEVSEAPETAAKYDVMGVPTVMLFVKGEPRATLSGSPGKADMLKLIEAHLEA